MRRLAIVVALGLLGCPSIGDDDPAGDDDVFADDDTAGDDDDSAVEELDDAAFDSQELPAQVAPGEPFDVWFMMRNTGSAPWSEQEQVRLGSQAPKDNQTWGLGRIEIEPGVVVEPGDSYVFQAGLTAPTGSGVYPVQWRMVREQVHWFGESTFAAEVEVTDPCLDHCDDGLRDCGETGVDCGGPCDPCTPVELAVDDPHGGYVRVAVTTPDRVMVVWHRAGPGSDDHVRWRCWDGADWSPLERVTPGNGQQEYPWIEVDHRGVFHLAHNDGGADSRHVHYNVYEAEGCAGAWQTEAEVVPRSEAFSAAYPAIAMDEDAAPYVVWSQSMAERISPFPPCGSGGECGSGEHCYQLGDICIPDYEQHFSWRPSGAWGEGAWTTPVDIAAGAPGTRFSHHGAIAAVDSGSVHSVFMHGDPSRDIYYARFDGTSWSSPEYTGIGAHMADVQTGDGLVHVFSNNARYATRPTGVAGSWAGPWTVGSDTTINFVKLEVDGDGFLHAAFNSGYRAAYARTDESGDWLPPKLASPEGVEAHEPSLAVDDEGIVHLVWSECTAPCEGEHGTVWYLRTRYEELP